MGLKAIEMVDNSGIKTSDLIDKLNKLYCDEWLAYIQYWNGAQMATGLFCSELSAEMKEHAQEELDHAKKLAKRIVQLGGMPVIEPKDWYKYTNCGYLPPTDPKTTELLKQNIAGERCAIKAYEDLIKYVKDKDIVTYNLAVEIMTEEIDHEQDLENIQNDIDNV